MDTKHVVVRTDEGKDVTILAHGGYSDEWYTDGVLTVGDYADGVDAEGYLVSGVVIEVLL